MEDFFTYWLLWFLITIIVIEYPLMTLKVIYNVICAFAVIALCFIPMLLF